MKLARLGFTLLLLGNAGAQAQDIDYPASRLTFTYSQMGVAVEGGFRKFRADIHFDSANPARSRARVEADLASIDTGNPQGDADAQRQTWFDAASHPVAKFVSTGLRKLDNDRYEASGTLSIKGKSQAVTVPLTVRADGSNTIYEGSFALKRLDFAIGEGVWADTDTVANAVQVRFRVVQRGRRP
jgi:polyisoprenoid-binding protein YceI